MESSRFKGHLLICVFVLITASGDVEGIRRYRRPPRLPPPVVKVGKEVISLKPSPPKVQSRSDANTVDIAPLLTIEEENAKAQAQKSSTVLILRRRIPASSRARSMSGFRYRPSKSVLISGVPTRLHENRRSFEMNSPLSPYSDKTKWLALQVALRRQRQRDLLKAQLLSESALETERKSQYLRSIVPLLYHYKLQKSAADKYYAKYLKTLQLLALATATANQASSPLESPELGLFTHSFKNSIYGSLLKNSSFVLTNPVQPLSLPVSNSTSSSGSDQAADASERSDSHHHPEFQEFTNFAREVEKEKRKLLDVFPPPQSEVPFGERTILMVRFPPVPKVKHGDIDLTISHDIDGGIAFGGQRWFSFGKPFDPFDHPWYHHNHHKDEEHHHHKKPKHYVMAQAQKQSSNGVIISQNFIYRPSIRFTNSDPKHLAKYKGDLLNGGPSIVSQLAKALAEGNRISNSYFLSKNLLSEKKWEHPNKKPPFVIVHLDTYTKKSNDTHSFGIEEQVEANYANGTIIYPTVNDPNILASTKFEFHNSHEIEHIFDKPLVIHEGNGWGPEVPVHPKGINEIKNFLRLMYKVHQQSHDGGRKKIKDLRALGDAHEKKAFPDSKPLLKDQIADRSTNWLHTSTVGIRSLSEYDDQFPYEKQPVVDVSQDYDHHIHVEHYHPSPDTY